MKRQTLNECTKLSVQYLNENHLLKGYIEKVLSWAIGERIVARIRARVVTSSDPPYIQCIYKVTDEEGGAVSYNYKILLTTTSCEFGGKRYWFLCPQCTRRVGILYILDEYFVCRICTGLHYKSQSENRQSIHYPLFHLLDMAQRIDELLDKAKKLHYQGNMTRKYRRIATLRLRTRQLAQSLDLGNK